MSVRQTQVAEPHRIRARLSRNATVLAQITFCPSLRYWRRIVVENDEFHPGLHRDQLIEIRVFVDLLANLERQRRLRRIFFGEVDEQLFYTELRPISLELLGVDEEHDGFRLLVRICSISHSFITSFLGVL